MVISIFTAPQVKDGSDSTTLKSFIFKVLIVCLFLTSCANEPQVKEIKIQWKNNRATGLVISTAGIDNDSLEAKLTVHLVSEEDRPPILGKTVMVSNQIVFDPLISLTSGMSYEVRYNNQSLKTITIPVSTTRLIPKVLNVYPTQDSLPENLLKIYLEFSSPMREDQAMSHISLLKNNTDTISSAFLDLQQELWNSDRTILTVWLHPGRIKRDLQPNLKQGAPLHAGENYTLIIHKGWEDVYGIRIEDPFSKKFKVVGRDSLFIKPQTWSITTPVMGTKQSLKIQFGETLVYTLLKESFEINNPENMVIMGRVNVLPQETGIVFTPDQEWKKGKYIIRIQSLLEDLAGNNLNRSFDKDISIKSVEHNQEIYSLEFQVQ